MCKKVSRNTEKKRFENGEKLWNSELNSQTKTSQGENDKSGKGQYLSKKEKSFKKLEILQKSTKMKRGTLM